MLLMEFLNRNSCVVDVYESNNGVKTNEEEYQLISNGCLVDDPFVQRNACKLSQSTQFKLTVKCQKQL